MAEGYVSRTPQSLWLRLLELKHLVDHKAYGAVCRDYDLRYLVLPADGQAGVALPPARLLYADRVANADLFDLAPDGQCVAT
jgi:hypothetical protein